MQEAIHEYGLFSVLRLQIADNKFYARAFEIVVNVDVVWQASNLDLKWKHSEKTEESNRTSERDGGKTHVESHSHGKGLYRQDIVCVQNYFRFQKNNECEGGLPNSTLIFLLLYDWTPFAFYLRCPLIQSALLVCVIFLSTQFGIKFNFHSKNVYTTTKIGTKYIWFLSIWWTVKIFYEMLF